MVIMVEIGPLTRSDRGEWDVLARSFKAHFETETSDEDSERTWERLLGGGEIRGIAARLDGTMVGIAHYFFHTSVWSADKCYLADLFVDPHTRRRGVATAMIEWVAQDAEQRGACRLHWHTTQDNATARALYDQVASFKGLITYSRAIGAPLAA
jgi:GNAT superfamily N-acetyltransferase